MDKLNKILQNIEKLKTNLYEKDFLLTWDKSEDEIKQIILTSEALRMLYEKNIATDVFSSGLAISQFRDNSTRTRFSFASAANFLGLSIQDLDESKSQIAHGETVRETSNMISFMSDVIGIRDDMYLGAGHTYMLEVASALDEGYKEGVLNQRPAIINLQCDMDHPTQSMSDLAWLKEHFGSLENLRGKKLAMSWAYSPSYGKPLSVPQGIIGLMTRFGMDVVLAHPEGYDLIPEIVSLAEDNAKKYGGSFRKVNSMQEAFQDADIVYPKSWAPYHVMQKRTELLKTQDEAGLKDLEKECLANNALYKDWFCDEEKMKLTKKGEALYMHCLPADISGVSCREGEVSEAVFEKYRIPTYKEASYKPFIIASMILNSKFKEPDKVLSTLLKRNKKRIPES